MTDREPPNLRLKLDCCMWCKYRMVNLCKLHGDYLIKWPNAMVCDDYTPSAGAEATEVTDGN